MRAKNVVNFKVVSSLREKDDDGRERERESAQSAKDIFCVIVWPKQNIKWLIRMILICLTFYFRFFSFWFA